MPARTRFVLWLAGLSAIAGPVTAYPMIAWQEDVVGDLLKIAALIALSSAVIGWVLWSLLHLRQDRPIPWRTALAGALTAAIVVTLPLAGFSMKTELGALLDAGELGMVTFSHAALTSVAAGLSAYVHVTKASLGAVLLSAALGYAVPRFRPG